MSKIISLESLKNHKAAKRGFREWQRRFKALPILDEHSLWSDLPDELILFLAEDDEGGREMIHDLLMGSLGLGNGYEFESLPSEKLIPLLDAYFILIDQVRFECLRRLGWITKIPLADKSIIELIREYQKGVLTPLTETSELTPNHPGYPEYVLLNEIEKRTFIRRTIPEAVRQFSAKLKSDKDH
ncbi:MAG: hypothetical protein HY787_04880 [Deltaproteobacteria bacterium]|nr:hypothetical protein [Deltaproteobacteria bacterium]